MIKNNCLVCKKEMITYPSQHRKYCSKKCEGLNKCGSNNSFFGKKHTKESKDKISKHNLNKSRNKGKLNPNWLGNNVGYKTIHSWIRRNKPKSDKCEKCNKNKSQEIALLKNKKHKKNINNYQWLCIACHREQDKGWKWNNKQKQKIKIISKTRTRDDKGRYKKENEET